MSSDEPTIGGRRTCKRPRQEQAGQPSQKKKKPKQKKKKHLYLVLDDIDEGFTIRYLDVVDDVLSAPPVARLLSPAPPFHMSFAAVGSHILATSNQHPTTLVYDTVTAGVAAGPSLPDALLHACNIFVPTADGDTLYAFAYHFEDQPQCVEVMSSSSSAERSPRRIASATRAIIPSTDWSWTSLAPSSPFAQEERVCSYAAHPDGHTVFVSATFCRANGGHRTFSFDTAAAGRTEWRCHGEWALPFEDQGYYDGDLDAWVGLDRDGHIGTCQVPSTVPQRRQQPPELDWKVAKEDKLWDVDLRREFAPGPALTCMGNARFCLVYRVAPRESSSDDGCQCDSVLRITTFRLRHSRKGELQIFDRNTAACPCPASSRGYTHFSPVVFWI